jgi:hypothetical protein
MIALLITLVIALVVGYLVKLIVGMILPRFADIAGILAFLLVVLSRFGEV